MNRIKVAVVGPKNTGKTCIANFLSKYREILPSHYQPTMGCRIVEWEMEASDVIVELWDCSGDLTYQHCWPAMEKDVHGIWVVINPGLESSLELYTKFFTANLTSQEHCWIVYHSKTLPIQKLKMKTPSSWRWIETNLDTSVNQEALRKEFDQFLTKLLSLRK